MSTHRVSPRAGRVDPAKLPRGPEGRALCRTCGVEVPPRRRTFCSSACADDWAVRNNPAIMRQRVFQRDKGVCARCGVDAAVLGRVLAAEWDRVKMARTAPERREREAFRQRYRWYFSRTSYWDADHIKPVSEGGGECSLENMRTLCVPCHQVATRELAKRTASHRRQKRVGYASIRAYLGDDSTNA